MRTQGLDMARTWAQARDMEEQTRQDLFSTVGISVHSARGK
ncbi:hypothetical protein [Streptomyces sp. NBC_01207]|nr:hypothetical protein OG457_09755 [Streptomyces sp. NBC_01207]